MNWNSENGLIVQIAFASVSEISSNFHLDPGFDHPNSSEYLRFGVSIFCRGRFS